MIGDFRTVLDDAKISIADGGMGTMLFKHGLKSGTASEKWTLERPEIIQTIHQSFVDAGAQIILTNTFGGNRVRLGMHGLADQLVNVNARAVSIAADVARSAPHAVVVAASIGPTGLQLEPYGDLTYAETVEVFTEQLVALNSDDVGVFWIETMSAIEEVQAAVEACRAVNPDKPVVATMSFDMRGHTMMGVSPQQAVVKMKEFGVSATGANCGNGPEEVEKAIAAMRDTEHTLPLVAKGNAGLPRIENGQPIYDMTPAAMGDYARNAFQAGAQIIGACCGSTPEHIRAIATALRSL